MKRAPRAACFVGLLALAAGAAAQPASHPGTPPAPSMTSAPETYGGSHIVSTTHAAGFTLVEGVEGPYDFSNGTRRCATSPCRWLAPLRLPAGAVIINTEVEACDLANGGRVNWDLWSQPKPVGAPVSLFGQFPGSTGGDVTDGCILYGNPVSPPATVDNNANSYILEFRIPNPDPSLAISAYRVVYHLQVSPAPAVATFADVPTTHGFFRFIEALAAAGITGGCTPAPSPNYCPDSPITRGQMAVFLAAALGLHFPN